jgi:predicted dehydrogenase
MVTESELRVAVLGAGAIAQVSHLPAYSRIPEVRVTAVCDSDRGKADRVARRFNVNHVATSWEEAIRRDDIDAVDICLPNHLHAEVALAALEQGKHVLCEKPFSRTSEEAQSMVDAAARHGRVLMGGFNNRFREDAQVLKRFVSEGELGRVSFLKTGWLKPASSWPDKGWQQIKRYAGGGVLLDLGVQMLDLALWFLDMPKVLSVSAAAHPKPEEEAIETGAAALLRLEGGVTMTLEVSWGLLVDRDFAYLNLFGDQGAALLNPLRLQKEMHGSLVNVTPNVGPGGNPYKKSYENEMRHFVHCARTGARPLSPGEDAVTVLHILEGLYRSAVEEREVRLD